MLTLHAVADNLFQINNLQLQVESTFLVDSLFRVNKNGDEELDEQGWPIKPMLVLARSLVRESIPSVRPPPPPPPPPPMHLLMVLSFVSRWSLIASLRPSTAGSSCSKGG